MRPRTGQLLWRVTASAAFLSLLALMAGFAFALHPQWLAPATGTPAPSDTGPSAPAAAPETDQRFQLVTLGDSLTRGTGDANGQGYVGIVRKALEEQQQGKITLTNLAINGLQSAELLDQIKQPHVRRLLSDADLILFTIGGNDLFSQSGGIYEVNPEKLDVALQELASRFTRILQEMRGLNTRAPIIYTSLYNPFGDTGAAAESASAVLDWDHQAGKIAAQFSDVLAVPTYDLFAHKEKTYLYSDHFHPNTDGYQRMAERILQAIK
ncbi:GDSL-type esterase/lipase family protein [Brevibacillus sp. B_LB10_24]|uniref:GDSL-type esterase/lipase family protein n=1 Tax=Brevibacillus sp. B_LB10_24 TaxID=3380645 RepID=UPI0038BBBEA7